MVKRAWCSLITLVLAFVVSVMFSKTAIWSEIAGYGVPSGAIAGFLILPHFLQTDRETFGNGYVVVGGFVTTMAAIWIPVAIITVYAGEGARMLLYALLGSLAILGPIAIPIGIIGAVFAHATWRKWLVRAT
jgi:hypothetical protein